jgi:hypothetical protein
MLLALLLASSQAALASHSTSHFDNDLQQCVFCMGQTDSKPMALHAEFDADLPAGAAGAFSEYLTCLIIDDIFQSYHSRAPPVII